MKRPKDVESYRQGYIDGMTSKSGYPMCGFEFMGYSMDQLIKLIKEHEERQPTKHKVMCDCTVADECPQGKMGMSVRCIIWKQINQK